MEVSDNVVIHSIMAYVVDSKTYAWMQANDCAGVDDSVKYADFLVWNTKCVSKTSDEERAWILALCLRFRDNTIHVTDLKPAVWRSVSMPYITIHLGGCVL